MASKDGEDIDTDSEAGDGAVTVMVTQPNKLEGWTVQIVSESIDTSSSISNCCVIKYCLDCSQH